MFKYFALLIFLLIPSCYAIYDDYYYYWERAGQYDWGFKYNDMLMRNDDPKPVGGCRKRFE